MFISRRALQTAQRSYRSYSTASAPVKRGGAVKGGLIGFLTGVTATSAFVYGYALDEYTNANSVIIKDVLSLSRSIRVLEEHVKALETSQQQK